MVLVADMTYPIERVSTVPELEQRANPARIVHSSFPSLPLIWPGLPLAGRAVYERSTAAATCFAKLACCIPEKWGKLGEEERRRAILERHDRGKHLAEKGEKIRE